MGSQLSCFCRLSCRHAKTHAPLLAAVQETHTRTHILSLSLSVSLASSGFHCLFRPSLSHLSPSFVLFNQGSASASIAFLSQAEEPYAHHVLVRPGAQDSCKASEFKRYRPQTPRNQSSVQVHVVLYFDVARYCHGSSPC